jgi:hypothetical protein
MVGSLAQTHQQLAQADVSGNHYERDGSGTVEALLAAMLQSAPALAADDISII